MKNKIAIIVATYNSGKTLEACLLSLISNKTDNIEIIIVDGESTDNTFDIVNKYISDIDVFITEQDDGIYDAWNKGVKSASSEWIMFVGSDDQLCPNILIELEGFILNHNNIDYISGRVQLVSFDQKPLQVVGDKYNWDVFRTRMNVAHVGSLHHSSLYEKYGYYDTSFKICGDYEFFLRIKDKLKADFFNKIVANMTVGGVSFASKSALIEARNAKLKHHSKDKFFIYFDYYISILKLYIKKKLRLV
jgi:glycosyltransferase involved in cell wall biosynthesis